MKITSVNNELIKEISKLLQKKYRESTGMFLLEGQKCVQEAIDSGLELVQIFILEGSNLFDGDNVIETTEAVLAKISDAKSSPKVVAVAKQPKVDLENFKSMKKVFLLEDIKDAGNLGTILRASCAFDVDGVVLYGDTVDLYNPKCVRSAVGNLWKIPVAVIKNFEDLVKYFDCFERVATLPKSNQSVWLRDYKSSKKTLVMFGSEANGLSEILKTYATKNVTIEMSKNVESLNLSVSASIVAYNLMD